MLRNAVPNLSSSAGQTLFRLQLLKPFDQVKKVSKWICKLCGQKQSVLRIHMEGTAPECRKVVQELNMRRGEKEAEVDEIVAKKVEQGGEARMEVPQPRIVAKSESVWKEFADEEEEEEEEGEEEDDGRFVLVYPGKGKRSRQSLKRSTGEVGKGDTQKKRFMVTGTDYSRLPERTRSTEITMKPASQRAPQSSHPTIEARHSHTSQMPLSSTSSKLNTRPMPAYQSPPASTLSKLYPSYQDHKERANLALCSMPTASSVPSARKPPITSITKPDTKPIPTSKVSKWAEYEEEESDDDDDS
ncbi:hypothetical protein HDU67_010300 [Dinochytrium kinnereticum]|nr:hypothetical protein HDU67_010300 [Dinochytrium kinnereticum]